MIGFPFGRAYDLRELNEWIRLMREVAGYLQTCRREHHGTDFSGRMLAAEALGGVAQTLCGEMLATPAPCWRHVKSNGIYLEMARGILEADGKTRMVVYMGSHDQRVWIRPEAEFDDGRFERVRLPTEKLDSAGDAA